MAEAGTGFVADAAQRLVAPPERRRALARHAAAALAAVALEAGVFWLIWAERNVVPPPPPQEIPVEIVVEPPPPPPPAAEPKPAPEELKRGTEAPREGKSDHDDDHVAEKETPAKAAPPPPAPSPSPEATQPPAEASAPDLPKTPDGEAPPPAPTPSPQPPAPAPNAKVLAALPKVFDNVPDVEFGGVAKAAPISGGLGKATYLNILYGLTKAHERVPPIARTYGRRLQGVIAVLLDGNGRLLQRYITQSSGSPELDEAEMQAVAEASKHFPPTPGHAQLGLTYTFNTE